jgi:hypothetical protein
VGQKVFQKVLKKVNHLLQFLWFLKSIWTLFSIRITTRELNLVTHLSVSKLRSYILVLNWIKWDESLRAET